MRGKASRGTMFVNMLAEQQNRGNKGGGGVSASRSHALRTPEKARKSPSTAIFSSPRPLSKVARRAMYGLDDGAPEQEDGSPSGSGHAIAKRLKVDQGKEWPAPGALNRAQPTMTTFFHKHTALRNHLGMVNLGNTCYMNAVIQVLLGIPMFESELAKGSLESLSTPGDGVLVALRRCLLARRKNARADTSVPISLEELKAAMERYTDFCRGSIQQDAHEFFCVLLERLQREILAAEYSVSEGGKELDDGVPRSVKLSETSDPVSRNFEFTLVQILRCSTCGHESRMLERFSHLSLELPPEAHEEKSYDVSSLLGAYMRGEEVSKSCDACGAGCTRHQLTHRVARLPQILVLHLKRFQAVPGKGDGSVELRKVHTRVKAHPQLSLSPWSSRATQLPMCRLQRRNAVTEVLASGHADKENLHRGGELRHGLGQTLRVRSSPNLLGLVAGMTRAAPSWQRPPPPSNRSPADKEDEDLQCALELSKSHAYKQRRRSLDDDMDLQQALLASAADSGPASPLPYDDAGALQGARSASPRTPSPSGVPAKTATPPLSPIAVVDDGLPDANELPNTPTSPDTGTPARSRLQRAGSQTIDLLAHQYKLCGSISHKGDQANEGHFISDVLGSSGCWVRYDDSSVSTLSTSPLLPSCELRERECYLLFYSLQPEPRRISSPGLPKMPRSSTPNL